MIKGLFDGKRWAALWKAVPDYYVPGFIMTLKISAAGLLTALILGVIFGTFSTMKFKPAKILSRIYVEFIQNTPLALQVLFYYSVLPLLFSNSGFRIPKFVLGVIGVGVYHGAYISEVIRTGIEAIPRGQSEAAASQGFSYLETMYYIINFIDITPRFLPLFAEKFSFEYLRKSHKIPLFSNKLVTHGYTRIRSLLCTAATTVPLYEMTARSPLNCDT